jgi:UDP-3-O-[3-hydroxymyristoyl] glucosamine N-acyltransferase
MNKIEDSFIHGERFEIGYFNIIGRDVEVGDDVKIGHNCIIEDEVRIGHNVIIQGNIKIASGTVIGNNCTLKHGTILTNNVVLKDGVFMGPNTITLGGTHKRETIHGTIIGVDCYIGGGSQIAANKKLCANVITGALSFVNRDITEPGIYVGIPVRKLR